MIPFSYPSMEAVLVPEHGQPLLVEFPQGRLGDLSLDFLIRCAAACSCTQIPLPEEQPYGNIDDTYF